MLTLVFHPFLIVETAKAQANTSFDEAFETMKADETFQFELESASVPPRLGWLEDFFAAIAKFIVSITPLLQVLFYIGLACVIAFILYAIGKAIYETRWPSKSVPAHEDMPEPLYAPDRERAQILLDEVDALAAAGRFDEAVHQLLYRSIQDIDGDRPNVIQKSFTAREIASLKILSPATQQAFKIISLVVETSYFGAKSIGRSEFETCREAYTQFTAHPELGQA